MEYIKVNDYKIVKIVSTDDPANLYLACTNEECEEGEWLVDRPLPPNSEVYTGSDIRAYTEDFKLRPLQELVYGGFVSLATAGKNDVYPEGTVLQKVENNQIVWKTKYDYVKEGVVSLDINDLEYVDETDKCIKTAKDIEEFLALGKIDYDTATEIKATQVRHLRNAYLADVDEVASNPLRWGDLAESEKLEVAAFRKALLDVPQQEGFPWVASFPNVPAPVQSIINKNLEKFA